MEIIAGLALLVIAVGSLLFVLFEYRIRQPDMLVLYEDRGQIGIRTSIVYPRHFSLPLSRTTRPIQLTVDASAVGNLGVRVKLVGSVALSPDHLQALIRVGGWSSEAVARAASAAQALLEALVREYTERSEIGVISSTAILTHLNNRSDLIKEQFGVEIVSLTIQSLEPTDPEVADALRQQEQARLTEQTEQLKHQARVTAAKAKYQADEDIAALEHALEMKKAALTEELIAKEAAIAHQRVENELAGNRLRLAFEKEELEVLRSSPELLMLTPQAARLAEASQALRSARTVISLSPQEATHGADILSLFQALMQKALETKKEG